MLLLLYAELVAKYENITALVQNNTAKQDLNYIQRQFSRNVL